jgi:hypothetical protein
MTKPFKHIVTIDYETRWSKTDYTLSKMTTEEYIRDPRFRVFGACLHEYGSDEPPRWYNGEDLHDALAQYDWTQTAILAHNAQFDVSILEWKYDCHPCFILDTLSMARALRGTEAGNSLALLAQEFDLPPKGNAVHNTDGLEELTPEIEAELAEYCAHDVMLCEEIFVRLSAGYPAKELRLIDLTLKMYTQPRLILDGTMLAKAIEEERTQREALLTNLGITDADLASNPKFAQLLEAVGVPAPKKISKTTGEETLALAKNDAMFLAIMNGENEAAALLCEARLKVKSTMDRTRAQRFLEISKRGPLPVPLSYYGAITGRWVASKGSAINVQNIRRGSFLRKAILAPMGHTIVVGDLSQIEPRVLAWLSDYEDMLDIFRSGADPYAAFGAQMFNIPGMTKESNPELRQSAKSALLGCFGSQTPVLTQRGWVRIVDVNLSDTLWDGVEWVSHAGLVPQGEKEVITAHGISATPDHNILTENGWVEWQEVVNQSNCFRSAQSLANSCVPAGSVKQMQTENRGFPRVCDAHVGGKGLWPAAVSIKNRPKHALTAKTQEQNRLLAKGQNRFLLGLARSLKNLLALAGENTTGITTPSCAALAGGKVSLTVTAFSEETALGATAVQNGKPSKLVGKGRGTTQFAQTETIANGFSTGLVQSLSAVPTQIARSIQTMVGAASRYMRHGLQIVSSFFDTLSPSMAGMSPSYSLIGQTTAKATNPATFGLLRAASTCPTSGAYLREGLKNSSSASLPLKQRMQTYDIAFAGPRNRYTILTDAGPLIVHNCGYGLGWASFASQLLVGFLGAPPIRYDKEFAKQLGVNRSYVERFLSRKENEERLFQIPHTCTDEELLIHAVAAKKIIDTYRGTAIHVVGLWVLCTRLLVDSLVEGNEYTHKCLTFRKGEIELPNGMKIRYPNLRKDEDGNWVYGKDATKLYAGKITNNITQALARIVMTDGMLRVSRRYPVVGTVHDELIALAPEDEAQEALDWVIEQMTMEPSYMPGIPLAADGGTNLRYGDAKQ